MRLPLIHKIIPLSLSLLFCSASFAYADEASEKKEPTFYLQTDSAVYPKESFDKPSNIQISTLPKPKSDTIDRVDREAIFAKVSGLQKQIEKFDELDRDLLFSHSKSMTLTQLQKKYTQIPLEELRDLKKLSSKESTGK